MVRIVGEAGDFPHKTHNRTQVSLWIVVIPQGPVERVGNLPHEPRLSIRIAETENTARGVCDLDHPAPLRCVLETDTLTPVIFSADKTALRRKNLFDAVTDGSDKSSVALPLNGLGRGPDRQKALFTLGIPAVELHRAVPVLYQHGIPVRLLQADFQG